MTEKIKLLYYALWLAHPILQVGIAAIMVQRGLHRKFKFFFGYILTQIVTFAVVFPAMWHHYSAAFYLYWLLDGLSVALGFGVIHEVFVDVFRFFHTLRDLGTVLFKWAGLVMLLVAGVVSVSTNSSELAPWMQAIITSQRCVRIIQIGMVLFLIFFAHYVGVSRRQHSFGVALGFGSFAMVELLLICSWVGNHLDGTWVNILNMAAYNGSLLVWLGYVAVTRPARDTSLSLLQPQRWEQSLTDIHHPLPPDSLIPMFEGMVDRALSRTQMDASSSTASLAAGTAARSAAAGSGGVQLPVAHSASSKS
ncbi:MAG TPA: hypothetical protein VH350_10135 [Candidatus Sulfotelmatobacter sp.]|jgi:hypothetical protein|nr:hypothetical protein [Candidatus Sulfotelmatobacter sp.]